MIHEQYRFFGKELVNSSGEFQKENTDRNKPKHLTVLPRYLKLNLWQEEKENKMEVENNTQQLCSFDQQMIKDPQFTSLYNKEIYTYLLTQEEKYLVSNNYMNEQQQPDLNARMRAILLDWLIDVHLKFKLRDETLYVTTYLIDRFLNFKTTTRQQLQLVGVASLFIACKYEEIYPPDLKDFVYITDNAYTKQDVLEMEGQILQTLDFSITQPSSYCFLQRFGRIAGLDTKNLSLAQYLLELSIVDIKFMNYKPSFLSAAAIYLVHKIRKTPQSWSEEMQKMTGYNEQELRYCAKEMCLVLQSSDKSNLQAVRKKFAQPKYQEVSRIRVERQIKQQK
ncbi:unnamed protein product (macronuclear) [Paramecium tetraurelia]|uniref:Chromosome undetermined scaffold_1, whole genome shotgun sequence n=1 Tax=Paramecium tetraurelia TaxID=5888 RepID=Q6BFS2_PARTE|nr:Mitotic cyclin, CYC2 [Paramecium tetraurelia strain d4-2]XP_001423162.1 uncharacterized protein GSPATT00000199001 [Paramecium tetraurelia]CAH03498.1 Mitotic cyclin, CYC2 [Paramecium tetraurelia]CAK55764.1 unnamed protein product [Paramecium tetraurelia]|eukprot:XP_001423162.1 hypothetical protein (macronuclear) [Paramecium tetraurelia strain d4-2]